MPPNCRILCIACPTGSVAKMKRWTNICPEEPRGCGADAKRRTDEHESRATARLVSDEDTTLCIGVNQRTQHIHPIALWDDSNCCIYLLHASSLHNDARFGCSVVHRAALIRGCGPPVSLSPLRTRPGGRHVSDVVCQEPPRGQGAAGHAITRQTHKKSIKRCRQRAGFSSPW